MTTATTSERAALITSARNEVDRWNAVVDTLLGTFRHQADAPPRLIHVLEALRNKRNCVATKVEALQCHRERGWTRAWRELASARRELRESWRVVVGTLSKEGLYP